MYALTGLTLAVLLHGVAASNLIDRRVHFLGRRQGNSTTSLGPSPATSSSVISELTTASTQSPSNSATGVRISNDPSSSSTTSTSAPTLSPVNVLTSSTSAQSPTSIIVTVTTSSSLSACTATVTSVVGQPFEATIGTCSQTLTILSTTQPQAVPTSSQIGQPSEPSTSSEPASRLLITSSTLSGSSQTVTIISSAAVQTLTPGSTTSSVTWIESSTSTAPAFVSSSSTSITSQDQILAPVGTSTQSNNEPTSTLVVSSITSPSPTPSSSQSWSQETSSNIVPISGPVTGTSSQTTTAAASSPPTPSDTTSQTGQPTTSLVTASSIEGSSTAEFSTTNTILPSGSVPTSADHQTTTLIPQSQPASSESPVTVPAQTSSTASAQITSSPPAVTSSAATTTTLPPLLLGSQTISQDSSSNFIIGSHTFSPGSDTTISGQHISAAPSGGAIIINGATPTASPTSPSSPEVVVVDGTTLTANTLSGFVIGSQTLYPGSAITASGEVITLPALTPTITPLSLSTQPPIVLGSSTLTANSASQFIIGSQTLTAGGAITVSGQVVSLSPTGNAVIINGAPPPTSTPSTLVTATSSLTLIVVAGETLTSGGQITVGGDVLSLAPSGTGITVVGTVTVGAAQNTGPAATATKKSHAAGKVSVRYEMMGVFSFIVLSLGVMF